MQSKEREGLRLHLMEGLKAGSQQGRVPAGSLRLLLFSSLV